MHDKMNEIATKQDHSISAGRNNKKYVFLPTRIHRAVWFGMYHLECFMGSRKLFGCKTQLQRSLYF